MATHTADCDSCDFRLAKIPARDFAAGSERPVYPATNYYPRWVGDDRGSTYRSEDVDRRWYNWTYTPAIGTIPQVEHTYAYLEGGYGYMNEHQLGIGETTCPGLLWHRPVFDGGESLLDVAALTRIAMERCKTAREAIQLMGDLAVEYGYYGAMWDADSALGEAGETLTVIDPQEAWVFHIMADNGNSSAIWVAQRVPDDHISAIANQFVIRSFNLSDTDNFLGSDNLEKVAREAGLWDPAEGLLDWTKAFHWVRPFPPYSTRRVWRVFDVLAPSLGLPGETDEMGSDYPFSIKPDKKVSVGELLDLNRDHYEGTPYATNVGMAGGPFGNPNRYDPAPANVSAAGAFERPIGIERTNIATVVVSRADAPDHMARLWFAPYSSHAAPYVPMYVCLEDVPLPYSTGSLFEADMSAAFWRSALIGNYAERAWKWIMPSVTDFLHSTEQELRKQVDAAEQAAKQLSEQEAVAMLRNVSVEAAQRTHESLGPLFQNILTTWHDGYHFDDRHMEQLWAPRTFYPEWWLRQVGFFSDLGPDTDTSGSGPSWTTFWLVLACVLVASAVVGVVATRLWCPRREGADYRASINSGKLPFEGANQPLVSEQQI